ncbi:hypothetical protein D9M71_600750 [compost metagenome]
MLGLLKGGVGTALQGEEVVLNLVWFAANLMGLFERELQISKIGVWLSYRTNVHHRHN